MLIDTAPEKRYHAIRFFLEQARGCTKGKLNRLLYLMDFMHFSQIGRSVTELRYFAAAEGPVPLELYQTAASSSDTNGIIIDFTLKSKMTEDGMESLQIAPLKPFDESVFSKREMRIMQELARSYQCSPADKIVEAAHLVNTPWQQTLSSSDKEFQEIPYQSAVLRDEVEMILGLINENNQFWQNCK